MILSTSLNAPTSKAASPVRGIASGSLLTVDERDRARRSAQHLGYWLTRLLIVGFAITWAMTSGTAVTGMFRHLRELLQGLP